MSIIQEALQKAQSNVKPAGNQAGENVVKNSVQPVQPTAKPVNQKKNGARTALNTALSLLTLAILTSFAIILGAKFLSKAAVRQAPKDTLAQDISYGPIMNSYNPLASTLIENVKQTIPSGALKPVGSPELVLNGIMYLDDGSRAIINNAIVGDGDSVSGAKVIKINSNNVILQYQDAEITLSLK